MNKTLDFNVSQNQNVRKIKKQFLSIAFTNMSHVYVHVHVTTAFLIQSYRQSDVQSDTVFP